MGKSLKWLIRLLILGVVVSAALIIYSHSQVEACSDRLYTSLDKVPYSKTGLLLGTAKRAYGRSNLFYNARIKAADKLYKSGKIDRILVSGDDAGPGYSEPADMKADLIELGVDEEAIFMDPAGFSTLDSVVRASEVFKLSRFTIISQPFHCKRALYIAQARGIEAVAFAAEEVSGPVAMKVHIREYLARVKTFLDTQVFHRQPESLEGPDQLIEDR